VGQEKLEFHQAVQRLKAHLEDITPLELVFDLHVTQKSDAPDTFIYELPVHEHGGSHKEQIDFLVKCDYDFFGGPQDDDEPTTRLSVSGSLLRQREHKYNDKIHAALSQIQRSYRHMHFFNRLARNVKTTLQNTILQQNKWLRIMQEEPVIEETTTESAAFYEQNQAWLLGEVENYIRRQEASESSRQDDSEEE